MKNVFNECSRTAFLSRVYKDFPEISRWVYWCYNQPAELRFGHCRILASTGVQQGGPLDPLLFSSVLLQFLGSNPLSENCLLSLWYLDDGTLLGLGLLSLLYYHALLSLGQVLACISIYPNVSCIGLLEIALSLNFLMQLNELILKAVVWSF